MGYRLTMAEASEPAAVLKEAKMSKITDADFLAVIHLYHRRFPRPAFGGTAYKYLDSLYLSQQDQQPRRKVRPTLIKRSSAKTAFIIVHIDQIHLHGDL